MFGIEAYEAYLLPNGTRNPNSTYVQDSLDYDPTGSQLMLSDGTVKVWQNYLNQATSNWFGESMDDYVVTVGPDAMNDAGGVYPTIMDYLAEGASGYREAGRWVTADVGYSYGADFYMWTDDISSPTISANASMSSFGIDASLNDYLNSVILDQTIARLYRDGIDSNSNAYNTDLVLGESNSSFNRTGDDSASNSYGNLLLFDTENITLRRLFTNANADTVDAGMYATKTDTAFRRWIEGSTNLNFDKVYANLNHVDSSTVTGRSYYDGTTQYVSRFFVSDTGSQTDAGDRWMNYQFAVAVQAGTANTLSHHRLYFDTELATLYYNEQDYTPGTYGYKKGLFLSKTASYLEREHAGGTVKLGLDDNGGYVDGGDFEILNQNGFILESPDGTRRLYTSDNTGALVFSVLP